MHLRDRIRLHDQGVQLTLLHLAVFLLDFERDVMSKLSDLQTSVATNTDLVNQLVALKGGSAPAGDGTGASDADLAGLQAAVDANNATLEAAISAASAPAPAGDTIPATA